LTSSGGYRGLCRERRDFREVVGPLFNSRQVFTASMDNTLTAISGGAIANATPSVLMFLEVFGLDESVRRLRYFAARKVKGVLLFGATFAFRAAKKPT